uniref:Uncharacterized protein LOC105055018 n=1 Tax=Elaeis guineensis var. tenera TaxID=51953 RepID=A0A8N4IBL7_ELAGV|nr:uncharacterized protein LOC105055018 [Elaeis guineensis]XP_029123418.1 uncharacterized protein LOC105055018 [Elaeis guineensis]XP_029123419.1 uncharacterized protein LOC105055018 [Elaeis guineensis]XP_029123420.1 uncharacterized protein LOC105055018 [Elaeis guineensis]
MPLMESKIEDGLSHNTSERKEDDSCSFMGDKGPNYKGRERDDQLHASSETSNLLSSTSSYDSCFENSESKVRLRILVTNGASEDVKIPPKEFSDGVVKLLLEQTTVTAYNPFPSNSQTTSDLHHQTLSGLDDEHHVLESCGNSISCISVVKDTDTAVHAPCMGLDNENATSCNPSTGNLLARKDEKPVQTDALHDYHIDEIKGTQNDFKRPGTYLEEYLAKNGGSSSANAGSYPKSEHSELHPSKSDNSSHHDSFFKERDACSQLPEEILKCYVANKESSLGGELAAGSIDGPENTALTNSDIRKARSIASEPTSVSLKDTDDARKCSIMKEPSPKSSSLLETANMQVSKTQPQTTSDSESSAEIEDDVKICDICGDAGQEELLAICSRCSDGAKHTYCMRVMLDKLPEDDWLCEECQLMEENENQKVDRSEAASEMLELPCLNEKDQSSGNTFNPEVLPNLETKEINSDAKGAKGLESTQDSTMRHGKNVEVTSVTSNKVSETSGRSTGITSPRKNTMLLRESSFNSLDVGKVKPVNPSPSCGGQSRSSSHSIAHSQASSGLLSKSASFNSSKMPKVKQLIESVPFRQKITSSSDSRKEGLLKTITKSASFKSTNSGCSIKSADKIQSLEPLWAEDPRGGKQVKERNVINKKNSSMSDRPSISLSLSASTCPPFPKLDIKFSQQIGKSDKIPDPSNVGTDRGSNNANNLGCKEVKKQSSFSMRTSGSTPSNGIRKSEDQKTYQPVSKENVRASSAAVDRACCKPDSIQQCSTHQVVESAHRDDKTKDRTFSSSSRQAASESSRILRCQRCNETGHTTQLCAVDKLRMSAVRPSAERNLREGSNKNNKWKDTVEAISSKTRPLKKNKSPDQYEEISTSSADHNSEVTSKDLQSGSLSCARNLPSMEETADGQEILRRSADFSKAAVFHVKQKISYQEETVCDPKDGNINTIPNISDELNLKPQMQILPAQASVLAPPLRASTIPKLEFIWQGGFKVLRTGGLSELCDGLQAHPSTCVSPKALEVAFKFPCIIHLEEVPRCSSWPLQFQENSPEEENIALFFFAKDIDSYKNNYSKLLETMLKNDLALKGNMDGAELFIFPSNLLPENSQQWNNLTFLWGVFRERKKKSSDDMPVFRKLDRPNLNMEPLDQDLPAPIMLEVSSSSKISSHKNSNEELSRSERSPKRKKVNSTSNIDFQDHSF